MSGQRMTSWKLAQKVKSCNFIALLTLKILSNLSLSASCCAFCKIAHSTFLLLFTATFSSKWVVYFFKFSSFWVFSFQSRRIQSTTQTSENQLYSENDRKPFGRNRKCNRRRCATGQKTKRRFDTERRWRKEGKTELRSNR